VLSSVDYLLSFGTLVWRVDRFDRLGMLPDEPGVAVQMPSGFVVAWVWVVLVGVVKVAIRRCQLEAIVASN
jgi:hypothetical protein